MSSDSTQPPRDPNYPPDTPDTPDTPSQGTPQQHAQPPEYPPRESAPSTPPPAQPSYPPPAATPGYPPPPGYQPQPGYPPQAQPPYPPPPAQAQPQYPPPPAQPQYPQQAQPPQTQPQYPPQPPPAAPYGGYGGYGAYGGAPAGGGAYAAPQPAGLNGIWQKWLNVTTKPGVASFANELPTANWRDIWLSVIALGVLSAITGGIAALYTVTTFQVPGANGATNTIHVPASAGWGSIIGVPLGFFIGAGILFLSAKIFGGTGTFLHHSYALMLFYVPIQGVIAILGLIPVLGGIAAFVLGIYEIVLAVFAMSASHRLTIGKSVATVLLPAAVVLVLACGLAFILAAAIAAALNGAR